MNVFQRNSVLIMLLVILSLTVIFFSIFSGKDYVNFADYFASIILLFGILISILIYLSNTYNIMNQVVSGFIDILIKIIPSHIPFGKKLKIYLTSLIKENKKIIIFFPYTNDTNRETIFLQLLGFLEFLEKDNLTKETIGKNFSLILPNKNSSYEVEIIFVKAKSDDITYFFNEELKLNYQYIIITAMSEIYKDAIFAKKFLAEDRQKRIKIIGALSSITVGFGQNTYNDENVIRVFPPDYDEAKMAINFLMSRIKSNMCHSNDCHFKSKHSNIIILYANEYGKSVKLRCKEFFELEMRDIYKTTNSSLSYHELEKCINFYSFEYFNEQLTYDFIENQSFEDYINRWKEEKSTNYFFLIGYQPNVSNMINLLSSKLENTLDDYCFLFSSPMSMKKWRKEVCETMDVYSLFNTDNYFLSANINLQDNKFICIEDIKRNYEACKVRKIATKNIIKDIPFNELFNEDNQTKDIHFIDLLVQNRINQFEKNNFITNFAKLGIQVVREYVQTENSLLICKQQVFDRENISMKLLVNGDSIDNFQISHIQCDKVLNITKESNEN